MKKRKTEKLLVRMTPGLKRALGIAAEKDSRSMAGLIEKLIKDHLRKEGISWDDSQKGDGE